MTNNYDLKMFIGSTAATWNDLTHIDYPEKITTKYIRILVRDGNYGSVNIELYGCGWYRSIFFSFIFIYMNLPYKKVT